MSYHRDPEVSRAIIRARARKKMQYDERWMAFAAGWAGLGVLIAIGTIVVVAIVVIRLLL